MARTSSRILTSLLIAVSFFAMMTAGADPAEGKQLCTFTSHTYAVGDVWYPRLGQRGALHCVACVCQEGGKINCTIHQCGGPECSSPDSATTNECCMHCSKEPKGPAMLTRTGSTGQEVIPTGGSAGGGGGGESTAASSSTCLHNGNVYRHKERFTSTSIGLKPDNSNQCVQCACQAGMVLCQLKDCPKVECSDPIRIREDCCPVCPDPAGRMDEMDNSPIVIHQQLEGGSGKMEDCISGGRYYLHGTTWHPVMGPFGPMDCVNCLCRSGRIECRRLECPARPTLNCDRPVKVAGRCCPVCPLEGVDQQQGTMLSSSPITREAAGSRPSVHPQHRGGSAHSVDKAHPHSPLTKSASSPQHNYSLCLPSDYDSLAYRAQGGGNASEFIQYIFQRVVGPVHQSTGIEHHLWMLQPASTTYKVQDLTRDQAEALRQRFRFVLLGATSTKNVKRFTKREKKLKPKCIPNSGCPKKIRRLERNLTLKEVTSRFRGCLPIEVEANLL